MSQFLRLLNETNKAEALLDVCTQHRFGEIDSRNFEVAPESFDAVPGKPFSYWVSDTIRETFSQLPAFGDLDRTAKQGLATADDFRFVRIWWESSSKAWFGFAKGGAFSPFYADVYLLVNWAFNGGEIKNNLNDKGGVRSNVWMLRDTANNFFLRPGLTWPIKNRFSFKPRALPSGCLFGHVGSSAFIEDDNPIKLLALQALMSSSTFTTLVRLMAGWNFEVGVIQKTPIPTLTQDQCQYLASLSQRAWSLKFTADSIEETSHAFILPPALRTRIDGYDIPSIETELIQIQADIDLTVLDLYGFDEADRNLMKIIESSTELMSDGDEDDEDAGPNISQIDSELSWTVGVAFGRFDWRLATGEREVLPKPQPFDPLPPKSPGMLPDGAEPFHKQLGILVDDPGHPHDLPRLIEEVLERVNMPVPGDVRRWLQKDFFAFHLQRYSKSRRKAPIYWPLSTMSGSYTLWIYYPSLTSQTLYTAINDFLDKSKLKQVNDDLTVLRNKGTSRTRDDEKQFESLQSFELELLELRTTLLKIAQTYQPHQDDGVQITAAPLWPLFSHKPWQKVLKDTWAKLEKGEYDWAHLAMNYWPERVREKCKTDKSLAIAHGLEDLYVAPEAKPNKTRGKKSGA